MIYLYYDREAKKLYLYTHPVNMTSGGHDCVWDNIESTNTDKDRGQVCAHGTLSQGIVVEFPLEKTVLTCRKPTNK